MDRKQKLFGGIFILSIGLIAYVCGYLISPITQILAFIVLIISAFLILIGLVVIIKESGLD